MQLGGTRHISAAQFAQDQHDAVALVASQDGRFTVFAWSSRDGLVHAFDGPGLGAAIDFALIERRTTAILR